VCISYWCQYLRSEGVRHLLSGKEVIFSRSSSYAWPPVLLPAFRPLKIGQDEQIIYKFITSYCYIHGCVARCSKTFKLNLILQLSYKFLQLENIESYLGGSRFEVDLFGFWCRWRCVIRGTEAGASDRSQQLEDAGTASRCKAAAAKSSGWRLRRIGRHHSGSARRCGLV
jgi:hypothetical protein